MIVRTPYGTKHARRGTHDVLEVGFAAFHSHQIAPIDRCPVTAPGLDGAIEAAWAIAEALRPSGAAGGTCARAHRRGALARLTRDGELIAQHATPTVTMGRATGVISVKR